MNEVRCQDVKKTNSQFEIRLWLNTKKVSS
jgi:hypothetical protein